MNKVISIFLSLTVAVVIAPTSYAADPTPPPFPPDYVAPQPQQYNKDGMLAFRPDGSPLAGFNADGSVNTNLPKPIDPRLCAHVSTAVADAALLSFACED
jgi:hypothetical protein